MNEAHYHAWALYEEVVIADKAFDLPFQMQDLDGRWSVSQIQ